MKPLFVCYKSDSKIGFWAISSKRLIRLGLILLALTFLIDGSHSSVFAGDAAMPNSKANTDPQPNVDIEQHLGTQIPMDLMFKDERGKPISLADACEDKPTILVLAYYTCPMLCTQVLNGVCASLKDIAQKGGPVIGKDFNVVTVSFNPKENYTLAFMKRKSYTDEYGIPGSENHWRFLVGSTESINTLCETVGFKYVYDKNRKDFYHSSGIMILTPKGKISRYFYGIEFPPAQIKLGLSEASNGKIGSLAEKLKLLCMMSYDPEKASYSVSFFKLVQTMCVITLVSIFSYVGISLFRERRKMAQLNAKEFDDNRPNPESKIPE